MYWPTILKDCIDFAKGCQECQVHAGIQHAPASELHSIIKPWPFRGWALDLIGEIKPSSSKNQKYILVGIDYFTKWIRRNTSGECRPRSHYRIHTEAYCV